ncbi:hypothetical protein MMC07_006882 [Pseudocyphellaria aurata]|nr:hypothetical protein [Pseudocyphellaria aurata]
MAPLEAEWLLWAKQLRNEHKILLQRIDAATEAAAQVQPLVGQTRDLAASSEHLQSENNALKERVLTLKEESADRDKAMATEIGGLKGHINELEKELDCVVADVNAWREEWAQILDEKNAQRDRMEGAKPQSSRNPEMVSCAVGPPEDRVASRAVSQATTTDSSVHVTTAKEPVEVNKPSEQQHSQQHAIGLKAQGDSTLEIYVRYGEAAVWRAIRLYETRAVKAFVSGMSDKHQRALLWETLTEEGWTWQNARENIRRMVSDGKKRKRR